SQVVRQRSAKPPSPVRFWASPPNTNRHLATGLGAHRTAEGHGQGASLWCKRYLVMRASRVAALAVVLLTVGCGPTAQKAASPSPRPASSPSPPADSGVVIFKLTLKGSIASDDGFDLEFSVPSVGQELFQ